MLVVGITAVLVWACKAGFSRRFKEFQKAIAKELNALDELVQGGCKAFAEDSREVYKESDQHIQKGKIAVVVVTPDMQRNGDTPGAFSGTWRRRFSPGSFTE